MRQRQKSVQGTDDPDDSLPTDTFSPRESVHQVQINLKGFADASLPLESEDPGTSEEQSSSILGQSRSLRLQSTHQYSTSQLRPMLVLDQVCELREPQRAIQGEAPITRDQQPSWADPYQQGGGSILRDGQRGNTDGEGEEAQPAETRNRTMDGDTSVQNIPQEDCGTQKSQNIRLFEKQNSVHGPPNLLTPRQRSHAKKFSINSSRFAVKLRGVCESPAPQKSGLATYCNSGEVTKSKPRGGPYCDGSGDTVEAVAPGLSSAAKNSIFTVAKRPPQTTSNAATTFSETAVGLANKIAPQADQPAAKKMFNFGVFGE